MTISRETQPLSDVYQRPLRDLRISVTDRCNFRCPYCLPVDTSGREPRFLKTEDILSDKEIIRLVKVFLRCGVKKLRVTGGEPLLRPGIVSLIKALAEQSSVDDLALTTNGLRLSERASDLRAAGLKRVTISLDALTPETFRILSGGRGQVEQVLEGIETARQAGWANLKINTVIQKGVNEEEIMPLVDYFRGTGIQLRFIEFMDVGTCNHWSREKVVPSDQILARIQRHYPCEPVNPGHPSEVARVYRYRDGGGEVGFISSITHPFCGNCSRGRLGPDGTFYTCLFASRGEPLGRWLRQDMPLEFLEERIRTVWNQRTDRYSELRSTATPGSASPSHTRIEMFRIGG